MYSLCVHACTEYVATSVQACSYVYMYVRVYVWVCVHVYASMYECAGMYMCIWCMHMQVHTCVYMCMHTSVYICERGIVTL